MSRAHKDQQDTRKRLLDATWRLLEGQRGQGVRLVDIAQAAGVSRQALYLHFGSRADLFIATVHHVDVVLGAHERVARLCQQACKPGQAVRGVEELVAFWGSYLPEIYGLAKALLALRDTDEAAAAAWADRMAEFYQGCQFVVVQLARDEVLAPIWTVETAADFLWALLSTEMWERLTIERGWSHAEYIVRMQLAAKRALVAGPAR
jgi:AcrR family transcriptional regulator